MTNPYTREQIDRELFQFIDMGIDYQDEQKFNELALKEFVFQYHENEVYRKICQSRNVSPESVTSWEEIPALATQAFKQAIITSFPMGETELSLLTSGTTDPDARGKIYRDKTSLQLINKVNQLLTKEFLFPEVDKIRMMLMVPSPKVAPGMPMAYGLEQAKNAFGTPESAYYISPRGLDADQLITDLTETCAKGEPCCLMGATSGFVYFFNICAQKGLKFNLPAGSRACDGGGYQGTFGDCNREQYLALVGEYLGIPDYMCVNTLGMGESGTNYFENVLRDHLKGVEYQERYKVGVPWTRTIIVGVRTGKRLPAGEIGLIRHIDLTNIANVIAVQTDNLGYETENGFEILGRLANSPMFSVQAPGGPLKDWLAGTGLQVPESSTGGRPAGHPMGMGHPGGMGHPMGMGHPGGGMGHPVGVGNQCSTVADGMMKHGNQCSTVADGMMKHGNQCSTVADGMMKQGNQCSTVADGMMKHGNQCSTVADGMMKHGNQCSTVADGMMKQGNQCSTVADGMLKQGNQCSTVADGMLKQGSQG